MFKKALRKDHKVFSKGKRIWVKRSSEYWLAFFKKYVLKPRRKVYSWYPLLFLVPTAFFVLLVHLEIASYAGKTDYENWFIFCYVLYFFTAIAVSILNTRRKLALVSPNAYDNLAKFIIKIKGDLNDNLLDIKLDLSAIEKKENLVDLEHLGLKKSYGTRYSPYQLPRYQANAYLKDGSFCSATLHQLSLKVVTSKRRSSGKTKTKFKRKHKFYYTLSLKLDATEYNATLPDTIMDFDDIFKTTVRSTNGYHIINVKFKEKLLIVPRKITEAQKQKPSVFIEMMDYLFYEKIVTRTSDKPKIIPSL